MEAVDFAGLYRYAVGRRRGTLVDFLSSEQAFTVVLESTGVMYSESGFFDPQLGPEPKFDPSALGLDDLVRHVTALRSRTSEKGAKASAKPVAWAKNSTFDWIDRNFAALLPNADLVLCNDGKSESCDFLLMGKRAGTQRYRDGSCEGFKERSSPRARCAKCVLRPPSRSALSDS